LCLTYRCNIKCANCSNLCTQAPIDGDLTIDNISFFLDDISVYGKIGQITLHGGEPVLNPQIFDIIKILDDYRKRTGTKLWLLTNNSCKTVREKITKISCDYNIPLGIATKTTGTEYEYVPVNESPVDLNLEHTTGCFQTSNCGICFNYLGWFPCSPLAAAARVFGYKGMATLLNLTLEKCNEYFNAHCKHCGFALPERRRVKGQTNTGTWENAFSIYKEREKTF
jgi:hypothetical protein